MYELFSNDKTYTFLTGKSMTGAELKSSGEYPILDIADCAMDVVAGILRSITPVGELAEGYGIDDGDDKQATLDQVNFAVKTAAAASMSNARQDVALYTAVQMVAATTFTTEQQYEVKDIFPDYKEAAFSGKEFKNGDIVLYMESLYKIDKDLKASETILPGTDSGIGYFTRIGESQFPIYVPGNKYAEGDIVELDGQLYISKVNGNETTPGTDDTVWEKYVKTW